MQTIVIVRMILNKFTTIGVLLFMCFPAISKTPATDIDKLLRIAKIDRQYEVIGAQMLLAIEKQASASNWIVKRYFRMKYSGELKVFGTTSCLHSYLSSSLDSVDYKQLLSWFETKLGRKIVAKETMQITKSSEARRGNINSDSKRLMLLERIIDSTNAIELNAIQYFSLSYLLTGKDKLELNSLGKIRNKWSVYFKNTKEQFRESLIQLNNSMYFDLSNDELHEYAEFLESKTGGNISHMFSDARNIQQLKYFRTLCGIYADIIGRPSSYCGPLIENMRLLYGVESDEIYC